MPLIIPGETRCAISNKIIKEGDNILSFPLMPWVAPPHPLSKCYDAIALRAEFNKWEHKDSVIEMLGNLWKQSYGESDKYTHVLFKDHDYIVSVRAIEKSVYIWFLKHLFRLSIPIEAWETFSQKIKKLVNKIIINTSSNSFVVIEQKNGIIRILRTTENAFPDLIELTLSEWDQLLQILQAQRIND
jgi:hypothetical protein